LFCQYIGLPMMKQKSSTDQLVDQKPKVCLISGESTAVDQKLIGRC
jgi:hypothetical protein